MTKWTKRDLEGYNKLTQAIEEGREYAETMADDTTEVVNGLSISKGKATTQTTWDMEKILADFSSITKEKYGKKSPRKASVKVKPITK